jgi:serine/threonine-protein kinase
MTYRARLGEQLDRYTLLELLGSGGQGEVWRARDGMPPHEEVALKLLWLQAGTLSSVERARGEAYRLAHLDHPGLVKCKGIFEDPARHLLGLVLSLVDGQPLSRSLNDPRMTLTHREALFRHLVHVLAYLHRNGIVHRDVKPENILVGSTFWDAPSRENSIKLVDLGISVEIENYQPLTREGVVGSVLIMPPESLDPTTWRDASPRAPTVDVFAIGVLGWLLFGGEHPTGLPCTASHVDFALAYRSASSFPRTTFSHRWCPVLAACLSPQASARPPNADAILAALDAPSGYQTPHPPLSTKAGTSTQPYHPSTLPSPSIYFDQIPQRTSSPHSLVPPAPSSRKKPAQETLNTANILLGGIFFGAISVLAGFLFSLTKSNDPKEPIDFPETSSKQATPPPPTFTPPAPLPSTLLTPPPPEPTTTPSPDGFFPSFPVPLPQPENPGTCPCGQEELKECGSGRQFATFPCGKLLPEKTHWRLRLAYVLVQDRGGNIKNLREIDPRATIRVCRAKTEDCTVISLQETQGSRCLESARLNVTIRDLTSEGLSIQVRSSRMESWGEAPNAGHRNGITTRAICEGLVFGARFFEGHVNKIAFFLDDP